MAGPLAGYKVLDLSQVVSGPLAAMLLADQGAEVIKVEPIVGFGDVTRLPSFAKNGMPAFYLNNNRGKRALALDSTRPEGRDILLELAKDCDIFMQNFRPGAIERMGLGYEDIKSVNPDVIYCSISGFGPTGPYSDRPVLDPVIQGLTGVIDRQFNPIIPFPDLVRNLFADKSTALTAAQALTAALLARERGHGGQHVEVPMLDACMYFFWPDGMMDKTLMDDDASSGIPLARVYSVTNCLDGKLVYFAANDKQRLGLFEALGHPEWGEDPRFESMVALAGEGNYEALGILIADAFASLKVDDVMPKLHAAEVPAGPVLTVDEVLVDEQVVHNGTLLEWEHELAGRVRQPKPAARFSGTPVEPKLSGAMRGQHTEEVLREIGRSDADIASLRDAGVIL
jgi:crotonobetainyl-CoA:carnitine CoA-transferase CaiB-like acyl-CoA transferase